MVLKIAKEVERLVKLSLAFHNINKLVEGELGLSLVQYHCLSQIRNRPGISARVLASQIGLHPSSLTQTIKRLDRRGLLFIADDPKDSRRKMHALTSSGKKLLDSFESEIGRFLFEKQNMLEL